MTYDEHFGGGLTLGALGGGALAALGSYLYYRNKRNQSGWRRFWKSLGWAIGGAALGGGIGATIGRIRGRNALFREAKIASARPTSETVPGRVVYVDCYDNTHKPTISSSPSLQKAVDKALPRGVPNGHAMMGVIGKDGSMTLYSVYGMDKAKAVEDVRKRTKEILEGVKSGSVSPADAASKIEDIRYAARLARAGTYPGMEKFSTVANNANGEQTVNFYEMSPEDLSKKMAEISGALGYGGNVRVYPADVPDIGMAARSFEWLYGKSISNGGGGYSVIPGGMNCGTICRAAYDIATGKIGEKSHKMDMLWGGTPSANAPSTLFAGYDSAN